MYLEVRICRSTLQEVRSAAARYYCAAASDDYCLARTGIARYSSALLEETSKVGPPG